MSWLRAKEVFNEGKRNNFEQGTGPSIVAKKRFPM